MRKELFVNQNNTEAVEQPGNTSDSTAEGLQRGGITPAVNQALAVLPPQQQEVVKEHLASQNKYITETRQKLSQQQGQLQRDVQMSGVLKELMKDSEFNEYLQARQKGSLSTFYREKSGTPQGNNTPPPESDLNGFEEELPQNSSSGSAVPNDLELRVKAMEQQQQQARAYAEMQSFEAKYPEYQAYLPMMHAIKQELPTANLEHLFLVAKGKADSGEIVESQSGVETGQVHTDFSGENEATTPVSPPPPVGAASISTPAEAPAQSLHDAFAQAKEQLGIDGPVSFQSS